MLKLLLAALFVLLQLQIGSANPIQNQCLDEKTLRDVLTTKLPRVELVSLVKLDAVSFIASFNAIPPISQVTADAVLLIGFENAAQVAIAFFKDGCMISRGAMPRAHVDDLLMQLQRGGA